LDSLTFKAEGTKLFQKAAHPRRHKFSEEKSPLPETSNTRQKKKVYYLDYKVKVKFSMSTHKVIRGE
jgi:hypothetical protein